MELKSAEHAIDPQSIQHGIFIGHLDLGIGNIKFFKRAVDLERFQQRDKPGVTKLVRLSSAPAAGSSLRRMFRTFNEAYPGLVLVVAVRDDGATVAVVIIPGALLVDCWPGASGARGGPAAVFLPPAALAGGAMAP